MVELYRRNLIFTMRAHKINKKTTYQTFTSKRQHTAVPIYFQTTSPRTATTQLQSNRILFFDLIPHPKMHALVSSSVFHTGDRPLTGVSSLGLGLSVSRSLASRLWGSTAGLLGARLTGAKHLRQPLRLYWVFAGGKALCP